MQGDTFNLGVVSASTVITATKTGAYSASARELVCCNPTSGGFTVTLPSAVGLSADDAIVVVNESSSTNTITVATTSSQTISGAATATITTAYGVQTFLPVHGNWIAA